MYLTTRDLYLLKDLVVQSTINIKQVRMDEFVETDIEFHEDLIMKLTYMMDDLAEKEMNELL